MNCVENLDGEIWRYVMSEELGFYPYMVSNMGRVKSLNYRRTGDERLLKAKKTNDGYLSLRLSYNGKRKIFRVHRLVALMFLKPDPNLNPNNLEVNHIDEDKTNNCVENLEWCDRIYNMRYGTCKSRMLETRKNSIDWKEGRERWKETIKTSTAWKEGRLKTGVKLSKKVYQYTTDGELVNIFQSAREAGRQTGFLSNNICNCCNKKPNYKTAYGFIWSYTPLPNSTNQLSLFPTTETEKN